MFASSVDLAGVIWSAPGVYKDYESGTFHNLMVVSFEQERTTIKDKDY